MPWGGDAAVHIAYAQLASLSLASGEWPIWTNYFAGGSPYLQFYGFLFFFVVGATDQFIGDIHSSLKMVMGAAHLASGMTLYALARAQRLRRPAAYIASLAYVLCLWHAQQVLFMGRFPLSLFYAVLPLPFLFFERARLLHRGFEAVLLGGLFLAALAFIHPGYGYWATVFYVLYALARSTGPWRRRRVWLWRGRGLAIACYGVVLGACLTLPMYLERAYTGLAGGVSLSSVADPGWQHLFIWSNFRIRLLALAEVDHHWYGGYLGLSLAVLALVALKGVKTRAHKAVIATVLGLALSLSLVLAYRTAWVQALPLIEGLSAGRYLLFVSFFIALAAGWGVQSLAATPSRRYLVILAIIALDLGTTTFQHPYISREAIPASYPQDLITKLAHQPQAEGLLPEYRIYATTEKIHPYVAIAWLFAQTGIPTFQALYVEAPRAQERLVAPWGHFVAAIVDNSATAKELQAHRNYGLLYDGARLQNIRHIIGLNGEGEDLQVVEFGWANHTPLLVTSRLEPFPVDELSRLRKKGELAKMVAQYFPDREDQEDLLDMFPVLWMIKSMGVHPRENRCEVVYVRDLSAPRTLEGSVPQAEVLEHRVWNQRIRLRVRMGGDAFVRLAYAYYPFLRVVVDGRLVEALETAGGGIVIELSAGEHVIELVPYLSPWRKALWILDGVLLFFGGMLWWRERAVRRTMR